MGKRGITIDSKMVKSVLCICQICSCGRHHCAHRKRTVPVDGSRCLLTEYNDTYREYLHASKPQPIKPNNFAKLNTGPFERSTMYKDTYVPHEYKVPQKHNQKIYIK